MNDKTLDLQCPTCGAPITYNPTLGKWKCNFCENEYTLEDIQKYNNASNEKNHIKEDNFNKYDSYICKDCGAEIIADEETTATFCPYCGNTAILKSKLSGKFKPDKIIPFRIEKEYAIDEFKKLSKRHRLMPKDFNDTKNIEKITGIYIPFWIYNFKVSGGIDAKGRNITSWTTGNKVYTKTDIYKLTREGTMTFERVPVDGSTRFADDIMDSIQPFNYGELIDYNHAYLSGFFAEKYDIESDGTIQIALKRTVESAKKTMLNDMGNYASKEITDNNLNIKEANHEYALFPVWMVNVKYKDNYYIFAMNGQTGKFIGNIPLDKKKTIIYSISIFIILFILIIIISYLIYIIGGLR